MPNKVEITEAGKNIVQISTSPTTLAITETSHTVEIAALSRAIGNATLTGGIDITNTIGDALAGGTYAAGTTLEKVVRDLISPFLEPSFSSFSWSATGIHQANGEQLLLECGLQGNVSSVSLAINNIENLKNNSNIVVSNLSTIPSSTVAALVSINSATISSPVSISSTYAVPIATSPTALNITASAQYVGDNGQSGLVTISRSTKIAHRHRFYVVTSTDETFESFGNLFQGAEATILSTLSVDPLLSTQSLSVDCTASTANSSNFTYIFIAGAGSLGEVAAEINNRGVADYTDSWVLHDNSGSGYSRTVGTASPSYKVYRSIQPGAFDSDVTLNIEILH